MGKANPNTVASQMNALNEELYNRVCQTCQALIVDGQCLCENGPNIVDIPKAKVVKPVQPNPVPVQPSVPQGPVSSTKEMLLRLPGAPTEAQIETWKSQYGKVYVLPLDRDEVYVWRYLNYQEFKKLRGNKALVESEEKFQEHVVMQAVMWPVLGPVELAASRAGLIPTLFGVIMKGSFFLETDIALGLIDEL